MRAVIEVVVHKGTFASRIAGVDKHVVQELRTGGERGFGKAEFELVAQGELVAVHEAAVCALGDPALAVVACC